jgi:pimeloyl-ACP methyl ester carboxylesterase
LQDFDAEFVRLSFEGETVRHIEWPQWLSLGAPNPNAPFSTREVVQRFSRNGFEWDIHGRLYEPVTERQPGTAFVLFHGGAGSEDELRETPDGRPGLAAILASQGYRALAVTFPGHYPPGGEWQEPVVERQPFYVLDRRLPSEEIAERNLRCTFNVIVSGAALLCDRFLPDHDLIAFGHSTGGPMSMLLYRFLKKSRVVGIAGWASGGPDGWYREWVDWTKVKSDKIQPLNAIARRTPESFRKAGYEDVPELSPWGGAEGYMQWGDRFKSQMKTGLCDNQHGAHIKTLREYAAHTGLPEREYLDHLWDPDPEWLARVGVLLLVGENDRNHWVQGAKTGQQLEIFMGAKFAQRALRTKVVVVPKYGHFGYVALQNERIACAWVHALQAGFFSRPTGSVEVAVKIAQPVEP